MITTRKAASAKGLLQAGSSGLAGLLFCVTAGSGSAVAQGLIRDTEIEMLLQSYGQPIFEAARLGRHGVRLRIINQNDFNAFVIDGRSIFMNSGTLIQSNTPNEVIGVIAHEAGHIAGGHIAGLKSKIKNDPTLILTPRPILTYRRVQESSADQAAIGYLRRTRQSGRGMLATFDRFAEQEIFSASRIPPYLRSHPFARDRISQIERLVRASPFYDKRDTAELQLAHDLMRAKLRGYIRRPAAVINHYRNAKDTLPARYATAIAMFRLGGTRRAIPIVNALIQDRPRNRYFWELKGDLLLREGKAGPAVAALEKAHAMGQPAPLIQIRLAEALIRTNRKASLPRAIKLLNAALVREKEMPAAFRQLAKAYYSTGREAQAYLAAAEAYVLEGKTRDAHRQANRAKAILRKGTVQWRRALDILRIKPRRRS